MNPRMIYPHNEINGPCPLCRGNGHDPFASIGYRLCQYCGGYGQFKIIWIKRPHPPPSPLVPSAVAEWQASESATEATVSTHWEVEHLGCCQSSVDIIRRHQVNPLGGTGREHQQTGEQQ